MAATAWTLTDSVFIPRTLAKSMVRGPPLLPLDLLTFTLIAATSVAPGTMPVDLRLAGAVPSIPGEVPISGFHRAIGDQAGIRLILFRRGVGNGCAVGPVGGRRDQGLTPWPRPGPRHRRRFAVRFLLKLCGRYPGSGRQTLKTPTCRGRRKPQWRLIGPHPSLSIFAGKRTSLA